MSREGRSADLGFGASSVIRALRSAQRLLDISHWNNLYSPLVSAFTVRASGDRTEAVSLSLFVVLSWEKRLLSRDYPLHELVAVAALVGRVYDFLTVNGFPFNHCHGPSRPGVELAGKRKPRNQVSYGFFLLGAAWVRSRAERPSVS